MIDIFNTTLEKFEISSEKIKLLKNELKIHSTEDLLYYFPFRYEDKSTLMLINDISQDLEFINIQGEIKDITIKGLKKRLVVTLEDESGKIELIWFRGLSWISKKIKKGLEITACGKPTNYSGVYSLIHPEIIIGKQDLNNFSNFESVYSSTETLKKRFLNSKGISRIILPIIEKIKKSDFYIMENIPLKILEKENLFDRKTSFVEIHNPSCKENILKARNRLKFEELFFLQIRILKQKNNVEEKNIKGHICTDNNLLKEYLNSYLEFELTNCQKKVIKEIFSNMKSGLQMNRLLQGDVGSGKTVVALMSILIASSNNYQSAFMVPTEVLAEQHFSTLKTIFDKLHLKSEIITGSTRQKLKKEILTKLELGLIDVIIGTHSLLEDTVNFKNLGLVIIDEQHKFGVSQRSKLWKKNKNPPHILIMTATPIPRTLAMTAYGYLNISTLDELPAGRIPIKTFWVKDSARLRVFKFIQDQLDKDKQIYIIYPLIEESAKLDYKDLEDGYESIKRSFPKVPISIVHGKMKSEDKEYEMNSFSMGKTKIMVATTVVEVGINVPNATVMIIESAERFGLAQLHQLRGRVGRGNSQSYCILVSGYKLSKESKMRLKTMVETTDGFKIADIDLKLRGAGNILGTEQSGILNLKIANLSHDEEILVKVRKYAKKILLEDPLFQKKENLVIKKYLNNLKSKGIDMAGIS